MTLTSSNGLGPRRGRRRLAARFHAFRSSILHGDAVDVLERRRIAAPTTSAAETEEAIDAKAAELTPEIASRVAQTVLLRCADVGWRQHLADGRDHRRWPFSSKRSAWPRELAAVREGAARAFDALVAEAEGRAVDHFPRVEVKVRQPQQGPTENSRTAASGVLSRSWTALGDGLFGADPR